MGTKLNKDMRAKIVRAALADTFAGRNAKVVEMEHNLAAAVRVETLGPKMLALLDSLPDGVAPTKSNLSVKLGGSFTELGLSAPERFPDALANSYSNGTSCLGVFDGGHPLAEQYETFMAARTKIKEDREALNAKLNVLVNAYSTVERLVEAWPEAEQFIPKPKCMGMAVPMVHVSDVIAAMASAKAA